MSDPTVAYYDRNAEAYSKATVDLDMEALYAPFVGLLPAGGRILDLGCGPGRDLQAFQEKGFDVVGLDASRELVARAKQCVDCPVHRLTFRDLDWQEEFDGIWACASLLHVPRYELADVLRLGRRALRPGGAFYVSFKYGNAERLERGRTFTDLTETQLEELVRAVEGLEVHSMWSTGDVRPDRASERWLNALLIRSQ